MMGYNLISGSDLHSANISSQYISKPMSVIELKL